MSRDTELGAFEHCKAYAFHYQRKPATLYLFLSMSFYVDGGGLVHVIPG